MNSYHYAAVRGKMNSYHYAALRGNYPFFKQLLDSKIEGYDQTNQWNQTPLFIAVGKQLIKIVELLLDTGKCDLDVQDTKGWTPLLSAIDNSNFHIVKLLLEAGANVTKSYNHHTPLSCAIRKNHKGIIDLVIKYMNPNTQFNLKLKKSFNYEFLTFPEVPLDFNFKQKEFFYNRIFSKSNMMEIDKIEWNQYNIQYFFEFISRYRYQLPHDKIFNYSSSYKNYSKILVFENISFFNLVLTQKNEHLYIFRNIDQKYICIHLLVLLKRCMSNVYIMDTYEETDSNSYFGSIKKRFLGITEIEKKRSDIDHDLGGVKKIKLEKDI